MKIFASVYIGSYEVIMKVFEISREKKLKEIDCLRAPLPIVSDIYVRGRVTLQTTERLCDILLDMKNTAKMYRADAFRIYTGYTLGDAENALFVIEQIKLRVKSPVERLSNSEHRFLGYEAVASMENFDEYIKKSAIIIDVGGASLQITLFSKGKIVTTQHVMLGTYSMVQILKMLEMMPDHQSQIPSLIDKELDVFIRMYLKDITPTYMIILGNGVSEEIREKIAEKSGYLTETKAFLDTIKKMLKKSANTVFDDDVSAMDSDAQREAFLILHREIAERIPSEYVIIPGVSVSEGIAYDYAYKIGILKSPHDFDEDVLSASWSIAKRYGSYSPHLKALDSFSTSIFDATKKYHGMGKRERLMMRVVCILHDCGKYISISEQSDCSYTIIMLSEILGLSHKERETVAMVVKFNRGELLPYEDLADKFSEDEYWTIVKLLAILRVANALDRSHKQKMKQVSATVRDGKLVMSIETDSSIALEKGMFREKADFFEQVFSIRPVIREKRQ